MGTEQQTDIRVCLNRLRGGSLSFYTASLLLPPDIRKPAASLYGFCRVADDAIDNAIDPHAALTELYSRLNQIYSNVDSIHPEDRAFASVVKQFSIPRAFPEGLLEGFAWDVIGKEYESIEDLHDYSARVAGTVGAMMAAIMGARSADAIARACELGMAMQLTNIARDVGEDAENGRLYLPREWLREEQIDPDEWLQDPHFSPALGKVIERVIDTADDLYQQAEYGISMLPRACRPAILAAAAIYREIGCQLSREGRDSVSTRTVVPTSRKVVLLTHSVVKSGKLQSHDECKHYDASWFLISAMLANNSGSVLNDEDNWKPIPWWNVKEQFLNVINIFERLEKKDRIVQVESVN